MKNIRIKLASQYQTIEFDIEDINEDLTPAINLINDLGRKVENTLNGKPVGKPKAEQEDAPATDKQINALARFGIDAKGWTKKKASAKLDMLGL